MTAPNKKSTEEKRLMFFELPGTGCGLYNIDNDPLKPMYFPEDAIKGHTAIRLADPMGGGKSFAGTHGRAFDEAMTKAEEEVQKSKIYEDMTNAETEAATAAKHYWGNLKYDADDDFYLDHMKEKQNKAQETKKAYCKAIRKKSLEIAKAERLTDADKLYEEGLYEMQANKMAEAWAMRGPEEKAKWWGKNFAAGDITNIERALYYIEKDKEQKGDYPEEIVLTGHSRGGINTIRLANEIYKKYGDKIKVHLIVTDPVPGPFQAEIKEKRIIPPNVASYTSFYSTASGMGKKLLNFFFRPHSLDKLVFTNKNTIVSSYAVKDISHAQTHQFFLPYIERARRKIIKAIAGKKDNTPEPDDSIELEYDKNLPDGSTKKEKYMFDKIEDMGTKRGLMRKDCYYFAETNLESNNSLLAKALKTVRRYFRHGGETNADQIEPIYKDLPNNKGTKNLMLSEIDLTNNQNLTEEDREAQLYSAYNDKYRYHLLDSQVISATLMIGIVGYSYNYYKSKQIQNILYRTLYFAAATTMLNSTLATKALQDIGLAMTGVLIKMPFDALKATLRGAFTAVNIAGKKAVQSTSSILEKLSLRKPAEKTPVPEHSYYDVPEKKEDTTAPAPDIDKKPEGPLDEQHQRDEKTNVITKL